MKGNQYMTNNIKTLSFNREQAENLYQDGMTNFASDDKYLKALGFFQQSVGGKTLNDKYNANVVVKDVTEDKNKNLMFVDVKPKSRADIAMSRFADILSQDEKQTSNEFDI